MSAKELLDRLLKANSIENVYNFVYDEFDDGSIRLVDKESGEVFDVTVSKID